MTIINSKTIARIAAIQFAYQMTATNVKDFATEAIDKLSKYYNDKEAADDLSEDGVMIKFKLNQKFFTILCNQYILNLTQIDKTIHAYLSEEWQFENMHITLKAILRIAVCEILYFPESPSRVIINEYTTIGSDMLKAQEIGFVNSILDTISRIIRKDEN